MTKMKFNGKALNIRSGANVVPLKNGDQFTIAPKGDKFQLTSGKQSILMTAAAVEALKKQSVTAGVTIKEARAWIEKIFAKSLRKVATVKVKIDGTDSIYMSVKSNSPVLSRYGYLPVMFTLSGSEMYVEIDSYETFFTPDLDPFPQGTYIGNRFSDLSEVVADLDAGANSLDKFVQKDLKAVDDLRAVVVAQAEFAKAFQGAFVELKKIVKLGTKEHKKALRKQARQEGV